MNRLANNASYSSVINATRTINEGKGLSTRTRDLAQLGLTPDPPVWQSVLPELELLTQTPWDFNHLDVKGLSGRYTDCLFWMINKAGERQMTVAMQRILLPFGWSSLQNPVSHRGSYSITEQGRFIMLLPYVLRLHFTEAHFKGEQSRILGREFPLFQGTVNILVYLFAQLANSLLPGLLDHLSLSRIDLYKKTYMRTRHDFLRFAEVHRTSNDKSALEKLAQLPNVHGGVHIIADLDRFGTLKNTNTSMGEERHKVFKLAAPFTNHVNIHLQLLRRFNVLQTVQSIAEGLTQHSDEYRFINTTVQDLKITAPHLFARLSADPSILLDNEDTFQSLEAGISGVRGRAKIATINYAQALDLSNPLVQSRLIEAYNHVGVHVGTVGGRLWYYKSGTFVAQDKRHVFSVGSNILWNNQTHTVLAVIGHRPLVGHGGLFLKTELWEKVDHNSIMKVNIYQRQRGTYHLLSLTSTSTQRPHLVDCGPDLAFWNEWCVSFH